MNNTKTNNKGFTLIELLIVIGIIAILAAAVIITITPGERLKDARDATRASHMTAIGNALHMTVAVQGNGYNAVSDLVGSGKPCGTSSAGTGDYLANTTCTTALGMGNAPVDPSGGDYQITAVGTDRIRIFPSAAAITAADTSYSSGVVY